jgi:hypothetical protein
MGGEGFEKIDGDEEKKVAWGKEEKRRRNIFPTKREKRIREMRYFSHTKHINIPFHVILPYCPCLKRVKSDTDTLPVNSWHVIKYFQ